MKRSSLAFILFVLSLLISGCAVSQDQGKLVRAGEVEKLVESATVLEGYTYYYTGPEAEPDAIIALPSNLKLQSKYWIQVEDVAEQLKEWNRYIDNKFRYMYPFEGHRIVDPDGKQVGIWYSKYDHTVVRFPDASSIIVYTPTVPMEPSKPHFKRFRIP